MSLETTFQILGTTTRNDATDVLVGGVRSGDIATQDRCIQTLAIRSDERSHDALIGLWSTVRNRIESALSDGDSSFLGYVATRLAEIQPGDEPRCDLVEMAIAFEIKAALPPLIDLAWKHEDSHFREVCLDAVLLLAQTWGHQARRGYPRNRAAPMIERERLDVTSQLLTVANDFLSHRCEGLLDALLSLSTWSDAALRSVLKNDTPCRAVIVRCLRTSRHRSVLELLAGFIRRRSIPDAVLPLMLQRQDDAYREILLKAISSEPVPATLNNLNEYGLPDCLRGGVGMLRVLGVDRDAAVAHAYSAAMQSNPETIAVLLEILDRQSERPTHGSKLHDSIVIAMGRCTRPKMSFWLRALNSPMMDDRDHRTPDYDFAADDFSSDDLAAVICTRLIELSQDDDACLADQATGLLESFNIHNALPAFRKISVEQRLRLGRALMHVDSTTIDVVGDGLRHAVMQSRLEAITFAQTLGLVDLMIEPLTKIAREDHQVARLAATEAFGSARGDGSLSILQELSNSQQGSIRDAAIESLHRRDALDTTRAPS